MNKFHDFLHDIPPDMLNGVNMDIYDLQPEFMDVGLQFNKLSSDLIQVASNVNHERTKRKKRFRILKLIKTGFRGFQ